MAPVIHVLDLQKKAPQQKAKKAAQAIGKPKKGKKQQPAVQGNNFMDLTADDGIPDVIFVDKKEIQMKPKAAGGKRELSFKLLSEPVAFAHNVFHGRMVNPNQAVNILVYIILNQLYIR
jgi:hypothetical protein